MIAVGTCHCINNTGKISQNIVARRVHNTTVMLFNQLGHGVSISFEYLYRESFIVCHQEGIPFDISTEDCSEFANGFILVYFFFGGGIKNALNVLSLIVYHNTTALAFLPCLKHIST